jgi:hypothetical protein
VLHQDEIHPSRELVRADDNGGEMTTKTLKLTFWNNGDRSVGIWGGSVTAEFDGEYDGGFVEAAKEILTPAFQELFDCGPVYCMTQEEIDREQALEQMTLGETMTTAHTPGPWTMDQYGTIKDRDGQQILASGVALTIGYYPRDHYAFANARLIAAAPDLLAALEMVRHAAIAMRGEDFNFGYEQWKLINAAIAKARATGLKSGTDSQK